MHVLVAAHDLYPDPGSGGTGRYVYETGRRLVERGHRVSVITRRRGDVPERGTVDGIDARRYDLSIADESAPSVLRQLPGARRAVRRHVDSLAGPPDLVSFQGPVTPALVDLAVPDAVPRVATFHSPWPTEYAIKTRGGDAATARRWLNVGLRWLVERRTLGRSDGVVALSAYMQGQLRRVYGSGLGDADGSAPGDADESALDGAVVPGGVDADRFGPDAGTYAPMAGEKESRGEGDGPNFLTVRRLSDRMGHDRLLDAFAAVTDSHPDARLFVAGDGPLREDLERRAAEVGVGDRTAFLGYVPDDDLPAAYATADAFVLPTQELEGFGLATVEALASGTPVVATPVGGTAEVLSGLGDRLPADPLVRSARPEALADGMAAWAALDDAERDRAGEVCRQYARDRYEWDRVVDELLDAYASVMA